MAVSKGKSKEWKKKCVQLLCIDVVMVIFVYQGGKKKKTTSCMFYAHTRWEPYFSVNKCAKKASWKARAGNRPGQLPSRSSCAHEILGPWTGNFAVVWASDDPWNFRQVFLCDPVIPAVQWVAMIGVLGSLLAKWSYCWARYLQEKLQGNLTARSEASLFFIFKEEAQGQRIVEKEVLVILTILCFPWSLLFFWFSESLRLVLILPLR